MANYDYYDGAGGTTGGTWYTWISATCDSGTSATTSSVWNNWIGTSTSSATDTTTTWATWVSSSGQYYNSYVPKVETAEEIAKRKAKEDAYRVKMEKERLEREKAEKAKEAKARQLLREVLTAEQDKQLDDKGYFELVAVGSGQRYRINKGRSRNINKIDQEGKVVGTVCFHPRDQVHHYDSMAIQKLMLENDEVEVRKVANFS